MSDFQKAGQGVQIYKEDKEEDSIIKDYRKGFASKKKCCTTG